MDVSVIADMVSRLEPGEQLDIDRHALCFYVPAMRMTHMLGPVWSPAERVMENIVGSAYEFEFWNDPIQGVVTFRRLKEPLSDGAKTYVSPDRQHDYQLEADGRFYPTARPYAKAES